MATIPDFIQNDGDDKEPVIKSFYVITNELEEYLNFVRITDLGIMAAWAIVPAHALQYPSRKSAEKIIKRMKRAGSKAVQCFETPQKYYVSH